jgi:Peptidase family M28
MNLGSGLLLGGLALAVPLVQSQQADFMRVGGPALPAPPDASIARALGAIQPARIQETINTLVRFGTRSTLSSMDTDQPAGEGINAAANWIGAQFEAISKDCNGCLEVHRDVFTVDPSQGGPWKGRIPRPTRLTNIYAILPGTDPVQGKRMYLVTGHYDSRNTNVLDDRGAAPGANDDGSGVAVSLECARVLSKLRFPSTLVFVAVAGEEQGLLGSAHLAHFAREQGWQLEAVLNNDIVGGNTTPGDKLQLKDRVRVFSEGVPESASPDELRRILALGRESDSSSRELARTVADTARIYFPSSPKTGGKPAFSAFLIFRPDRYLRGGDHSSFNREGFAAVRLTEWREDFHHQHQNVVLPPPGSDAPIFGDLSQFVDFSYVAQVARLNAATLAALARSPGEPRNVAIDLHRLDNETTLRWDPPVGAGSEVHYELVWRQTAAPDWQYELSAKPEGGQDPVELTVPISKDNVIFGIRAVDRAGHRSLVVVP